MFLQRFCSGDVSQSPPSLLTLVQDMDVELVGLSQESGMLRSTLSDSRIRAKVVESIIVITHSTAKAASSVFAGNFSQKILFC